MAGLPRYSTFEPAETELNHMVHQFILELRHHIACR